MIIRASLSGLILKYEFLAPQASAAWNPYDYSSLAFKERRCLYSTCMNFEFSPGLNI